MCLHLPIGGQSFALPHAHREGDREEGLKTIPLALSKERLRFLRSHRVYLVLNRTWRSSKVATLRPPFVTHCASGRRTGRSFFEFPSNLGVYCVSHFCDREDMVEAPCCRLSDKLEKSGARVFVSAQTDSSPRPSCRECSCAPPLWPGASEASPRY